jgi:hypothetical protein
MTINIFTCKRDYKRDFGLENGFNDHLHTRLGTTSNYSATANHNSQITIAPAKSFPACSLHQPLHGNGFYIGDSSASRAQVLTSQPSAQNSLNLLSPLLVTYKTHFFCCCVQLLHY